MSLASASKRVLRFVISSRRGLNSRSTAWKAATRRLMPSFWSPKASVSMMANLPSAMAAAVWAAVGAAGRGVWTAGAAGRAAGWVWAEAVSAAVAARAAAKRVVRIAFMIFPVLLLKLKLRANTVGAAAG